MKANICRSILRPNRQDQWQAGGNHCSKVSNRPHVVNKSDAGKSQKDCPECFVQLSQRIHVAKLSAAYICRMKFTDLPSAHCYSPEIRFVDIDAAGIVNNATYLNYFEQSRIQFFEGIVGKKWDWNSAGMVIARHEVNYLLPIFLQDEVTIITWIEKVGNKSMEAAYEIYKRSGSSVVQVATAKTVMVSFDHAQGVSIPWRDELRAPLEGFGIGRPLGL